MFKSRQKWNPLDELSSHQSTTTQSARVVDSFNTGLESGKQC